MGGEVGGGCGERNRRMEEREGGKERDRYLERERGEKGNRMRVCAFVCVCVCVCVYICVKKDRKEIEGERAERKTWERRGEEWW